MKYLKNRKARKVRAELLASARAEARTTIASNRDMWLTLERNAIRRELHASGLRRTV